MENKCLYCYEPLEPGHDLHKKCALEFYVTPKPPLLEYSLDQMNELAKNVVERSVSVPGVQAKLSLSVVKETMEKSDTRLTVMDALGGRYIFKPPVDRYPEMPQNEHVTAKIAQTYGIRVVPASLIRLASGELSYITKRVDRKETGEKIHMLDMFQITEAFDKYKSSMEKVGKALDNYSDNTVLDKLFYFELALFSFLSGNNDMHLKNFSMIESPSGWVLAPAYDLLNVTILNPEDDEERALTLAGKKKKLKREHFEQLGKGLGLTDRQLEATYKRFVKNKPVAIDLLNRSFLSDTMKMAYIDVLERRYKQLELNV
jgi:serine/threonine-protein kinase HipA